MEIGKQETKESQIEHTLLSKQHDNTTVDNKLCLKSPPYTDVIIISDDEEEEATLGPEKKKPKLGFPRDNGDALDELSKVVKGLPETKEDSDVSEKKTGEKNVVESTTKTNKGYGHVSLDDLGVSVEDLKRIPWEAFDPTWEIRSWAKDPWLGGYIQDMFSPQNNSDS